MSTLADLESLLLKVKAGKIPALVLIYGDQDYLVKQAYDRLLEAVVPEDLRSFNLEQMDGARADARDITGAYDIVPMMPGPKVLGVVDARFFQSKSNAHELLAKAREAWEKRDVNASLRQLGRLLALLGWSWADAQGKGAADLGEALESDQISESAHGGEWLARALAQGLGADFPLPSSADESGELLEALQASLATQGDTPRCLVFAAHAADGRKKLFKFVQEKGLVLEFKTEKRGPQAAQTASVFLRNMLNQRGLKMGGAFSQRFISAYGHDLGLLEKELDKLESHAHPRKDLGEADLAAVGSPQPEDSVFELLAALGRKKSGLKDALPLLRSLLEREPAPMLFAMLVNEVRLLHLCKTLIDEGRVQARAVQDYAPYKASAHPKLCAELPAGLAAFWKKTHPFVSYQALGRARAWDGKDLRGMLQALLDADLRVKTGGDAASELETLCLRLAGVEEEVVI